MELFNPEFIIHYGGIFLLLLIVFIETGVFFGFFLPGDSLLFTAGLLTHTKYLEQPVTLLIALLILATIAGTTVGYVFGRWAGTFINTVRGNLLFKKQYLDIADSFYRQHGMLSFIAGRFFPVVRTFIPILAGILKLDFRSFMIANLVGATVWVVILVMAGYWLGSAFPSIIDHLEVVIVLMILITTLPVIFSMKKRKAV